jgi:flagella basal body P-ring formation protein FlgA
MKSWCLAFILFLSFAARAAGVLEAGKIELHPEVYVSEDKTLTLADIASFENIDSSVLSKLKALPLGQAPRLGEKHSYTSIFLSGLLRKALDKVPSVLRDSWVIHIPSKVVVSNQGYHLDSRILEEKLSKHWRGLCADCKFIVMNLIAPQIPEELQKYPWEIRFTDSLPRGQFALPLEVKDDQNNSHLFWVRGQAQIQREVPVATRAINFGERLSDQDFELQWKDVTFAYDSFPAAMAIAGRKAGRSLRNGEPIFTGMLEREKALKRGDSVKVILSEDNWRVILNGVAEEDGYVGDTVKVRNEKSKKQISGVVNAEGEVVVR